MRNKALKLSGAAAARWDDPAVLWSQANGSAGDAAPVAAAGAWAHRGPSLDLGMGGAAENGHAWCGVVRVLVAPDQSQSE